ncbi:MAG: tRNA (adenosine(37)-N6)-threonylcarbamoyltransferase complex dimerization subunit type 1 TsaB [Gammaproteobacteria bacterium]|nr:tRNA (adenosine(37)-N6)-threonylcarbamoyltransferase complex dimerization subunit type 1 TsaB [Gammaproteobacteria bacterium]
MKVLAVDAASGQSSVALIAEESEFYECARETRAHADQLLPLVTRVLEAGKVSLADLDGLAFGRGPGGFTGLRVAAAVVQGLAFGYDKPVAGISTLAALAQPWVADHDVLVCTDARKGQVYTGTFTADATGLARVQGVEQVVDPDAVSVTAVDIIGVGDGFDAYPELRDRVERYHSSVNSGALAIARLAAAGWADFMEPFHATPVYVRDSVTHSK